MNYTVRQLALAETDFEQIYDYLKQRSFQGANTWKQAFEKCLDRLKTNPTAYSLAPENDLYSYPLYQILFRTKRGKRYRIVYRIDGQQVTIYRLRGHGQSLLKKEDLPDN